jgi:hypothetical protein
MDDAAFLDAFESGALPNSAFHHRDHLRLSWLYLRRDGPEVGTQRIIDGIRHFATAHGAAERFHVTLTEFWIRFVQHLIEAFPGVDRFDGLLARFPPALDKTIVNRHYTGAVLWSTAARAQFVSPDLRPLP